ncbi:MAG TPA: hypothetical protein VJH65_03715 [Candidatus Nanoarchaeia archaeon]|nr:hypothetical protein [Candidatus Nanoarchaeia archaeon]
MIERKVHYNFIINHGEQIRTCERYRWTVAVLNEPREIKRIEQRFFEQLARVDNINSNYESLIKNSGGLYCKIFSFSSDCGKVNDHETIYDSKKFKRDRNLSERAEEEYEKYVAGFIK